MKFGRKSFICPFCFNRNDLSKIEFRCSNTPSKCSPELDTIYSDFRGSQRMLPKAFSVQSSKMLKEAQCPNCDEKTSNKICPSCHSELPYTVGEFEDLIFAVIGAKDVGKSHYISVLIEEIKNKIGASFDCTLQPLNDETIKHYKENFYDTIYRKGEIIKGNVSARADFRVKIPLIYTISFTKKGLFKNKKVHAATLVFFDTAGEDLNAEDIMVTENKYIYNASGIILLLDPLQLPEVRAKLTGSGIPLPEEETEVNDILARTSNLIRKAKGLKKEKKINIPLALAISKIDAVDSLIDASSCLKYESNHSNAFDFEDFQSVQSEMESLITEWSGSYLIQQLNSFKKYAFFGLSALGESPVGEKIKKKPRPSRVEDPFLWLLCQHGLISKKGVISVRQRLKYILFFIIALFLITIGGIYSYQKYEENRILHKEPSNIEKVRIKKRVIIKRGMNLSEIGNHLKKLQFISSTDDFIRATRILEERTGLKYETKLKAGVHMISPGMSHYEILETLVRSPVY